MIFAAVFRFVIDFPLVEKKSAKDFESRRHYSTVGIALGDDASHMFTVFVHSSQDHGFPSIGQVHERISDFLPNNLRDFFHRHLRQNTVRDAGRHFRSMASAIFRLRSEKCGRKMRNVAVDAKEQRNGGGRGVGKNPCAQ